VSNGAQAGTTSTLEKEAKRLPSFGCSTPTTKKEGARRSDFSGCFRGADQSGGPIKVRITELYSSRIFSVKVSDSGEFSLKSIPAGNYMLVATQADKTIALKTIRLPAIRPIVMNLEPFSKIAPIDF
jgi:hypothetical protein